MTQLGRDPLFSNIVNGKRALGLYRYINHRCRAHNSAFTLPYKRACMVPEFFPRLHLHGTSMFLFTSPNLHSSRDLGNFCSVQGMSEGWNLLQHSGDGLALTCSKPLYEPKWASWKTQIRPHQHVALSHVGKKWKCCLWPADLAQAVCFSDAVLHSSCGPLAVSGNIWDVPLCLECASWPFLLSQGLYVLKMCHPLHWWPSPTPAPTTCFFPP